MLGDTAVAVHPSDERYADLVGHFAVLPLVGRRIPIVADDYADPEKGSGAVKITPAHDFNDFEVGKRHKLRLINILDADARLTLRDNEAFADGLAPSADLDAVLALHGLSREEARKRVVAMMEERGLLAGIEPHTHAVPHGDRSNVVIEPWLTDQWYVDAATLAKPALAAVRDGRTAFVPKNWEKTYFDWLENIQPWCISRQLWWGHRIPAWYGPDGQVFVAASEAEAQVEAVAAYGDTVELTRDEDVLDTWFSSALWPFSTLGWPRRTPELARFYPTSTLVTGFDIIFFWVARMMMFGLHFTGEAPFSTVYMHALVRDEKGAKMSKSKGNVINPLDLIASHGADALRFTLAAMAAQGRDIKLATARVDGYRAFATKLWQAARFAEMNGCVRVAGFDPAAGKAPLNRWIVDEADRAVAEVTDALDAYRFNDAAAAVYRFVWNVFCDWFIELAKPVFAGDDAEAKAETQATTAWTIDVILKLLHPFMPFITEELWAIKGAEGPPRETLLALAAWPAASSLSAGADAAEVGWLIDLVSDIRSIRSELNVPATALVPLVVTEADAALRDKLDRWAETLRRLARVPRIAVGEPAPKGAVPVTAAGLSAALPLGDVIDMAAERSRLDKESRKLEVDIGKIDAKLGNADFLSRAKEEVVEENRERRAEAQVRLDKLRAAAARLTL
jgi:valyl-tRNA synthetase